MSTRCNVVLDIGTGTRIWLYRHHDGYLAGAGRTLVDLVKKVVEASVPYASPAEQGARLLQELLAFRYESDTVTDRPVYEITEDAHGDIEYLYRVRFAYVGRVVEVQTGVKAMDWNDNSDKRFDPPAILTTVEELEAAVVAEEKVMEARIAARKANPRGW